MNPPSQSLRRGWATNERECSGLGAFSVMIDFLELPICVNLRLSAVKVFCIFIDLQSSLACLKSELSKNRPCCSGSVDR